LKSISIIKPSLLKQEFEKFKILEGLRYVAYVSPGCRFRNGNLSTAFATLSEIPNLGRIALRHASYVSVLFR
jgi:hypothetical protein